MTAIIGADAPLSNRDALMALGFDVITLPRFESLPSPIASHPDSLIFLAPGVLITHKNYYDIATDEMNKIAELSNAKILLSDETVTPEYPYDVLFNAAFLDGKIICNKNTVSSLIIEYAEKNSLEIISTKQGYAKCSTLVLDENSIITSDVGIHTSASLRGVNSLLISIGHIGIHEYGYGFIGGTGGVYKGTVYFNGDITAHPDFNKINAFCGSRSINIALLNRDKLFDIGTVFFI